jgi:hypothetical protein
MKHPRIHMTFMCLLFFVHLSIAQTIQNNLYYDVDYSALTPAHQLKLDTWLDSISLENLVSLQIVGHTDTSANLEYNKLLSQKRAAPVRAYFLSKGVDKSKIKFSFYGETQALSTDNLRKDRRVDIILEFQNTLPPIPPIEVPEAVSTTSIKNLYKLLALTPQEFCINPNRDTIIHGKYGTLVTIKANSFKLTPSQKASATCINFQVKEAFLKSEMFLENLNTMTTDGRLLETQGMVYTNAMIGADTLELIQDIIIMVSTDEIVEDVKVFDGARDLHTDAVNWAFNNNSVLRNFSVADVQNCVSMNDIHRICDCQDSLIGITKLDKIDCCYDRLMNEVLNSIKDSLANYDCKCPLLFCGFNRSFLWTAALFDQQIRELNKKTALCRKRLGAVLLLKRLRNRNGLDRSRKGCFLLNFGINFTLIIPKIFIRKKARKKKVKMTEREKKIMDLTQLIIDSDDKIRIGLKGMLSKNFVTKCNELDSLFKSYQVNNTAALVHALNQPLMDELGVTTMEALLDTLPKVNLAYLEIAYRDKKIAYEDYKFYVFNSSMLGWQNLDIFAKIPPEDQLLLKVNAVPDSTIDCKLIFKEEEFVLPAKVENKFFYFEGVPRNRDAWLIGIQYKNARPLFSIELITIKKKTYNLNLKELSLEELKKQLKQLDFTN